MRTARGDSKSSRALAQAVRDGNQAKGKGTDDVVLKGGGHLVKDNFEA